MIELRTLGAVHLRSTGQSADVRSVLGQHKRLAILVYLAVSAPRGYHTRDELMNLFWPELDTDRARNALRQAIFFLRNALGTEVLTGRGKGEVGLAEGQLWVDAVAFDEAHRSGDLQTAAELYQGDFLPAFHVTDASAEFGFWLDTERNRLRNAGMAALRTLAEREESAGRAQAAAALLRRAVQIDPDDEPSVRRLIALLGELGDRSGALQIYEAFRDRTMEEYAVPPAPETEATMRSVLDRQAASVDRVVPPAGAEIPVPLTPLIGREHEAHSILGLLQRTDVRLLTLTGPGGSGKTRLALEVASRYGMEGSGTVRFVPLESVESASLVMPAIATAVGAPPEADALVGLTRFLARRDLLLVLDNMEHLTDAALELVGLLQAAPGVKILTTSREALRVRGERTFEVPPLKVPDADSSPETVGSAEAVMLFVERARAVTPGFRLTPENAAAVVEVCRRVDGLPLAVELAAARTRLFTPQALAEQLAQPLALLKDGPRDLPARHQALDATIRWSYDLLTEDERTFLRRAALFVAGAPLPAAYAMWVAGGGTEAGAMEIVTSVVDKSLLRPEPSPGGETRIGMLATIREFGLAELARTGEAEKWALWQARHWLDWTEPGEGTYCTVEEPAWFERLDREHDNLRAALRWALEGGDPETALRLGTVLWWFWWTRGHFAEGRRWIERALARGKDVDPAVRARALLGAAQLAGGQGDQRRAIRLMEESLALHRELGDEQGIAMMLLNLGYAARAEDDPARAKAYFEESLTIRKSFGDVRGHSLALEGLGTIALTEGDLDSARRLFEESRELAQRVGHRNGVAKALLGLGDVARLEGIGDTAAELYQQALERYQALKQTHGIGQALRSLAAVELKRGAEGRAGGLYAEALELYREAGYAPGVAAGMIGIGLAAARQGWHERAAVLLGAADAYVEAEAVRLEPEDGQAFEEARAAARSTLDENEFASRWGEGRALAADAAMDLALEIARTPASQRARRAIR